MANNNKSIQVKTKHGTIQVKRLSGGFQIIGASHDLQVIHSMNLTDEAMMSLNFCVGYLIASEGLAKSEPKVAQVASKPKSKPEKVTVEFSNIRWRESDNRTGELPYRLVATLKDDQSKAERDSLFAKKFKCLPIGYEFRVMEGGKK